MQLDIVVNGQPLPKVIINQRQYIGMRCGQRYAVRLANPGPVSIIVKLTMYGIPQQRCITRLRDFLDRHPDEWRLKPGDTAYHPPEGRHFVYDGQATSVVAEVFDLDGQFVRRQELQLRPPEVIEQLWQNHKRKARHKRWAPAY